MTEWTSEQRTPDRLEGIVHNKQGTPEPYARNSAQAPRQPTNPTTRLGVAQHPYQEEGRLATKASIGKRWRFIMDKIDHHERV
jgi:hypothetical protein